MSHIKTNCIMKAIDIKGEIQVREKLVPFLYAVNNEVVGEIKGASLDQAHSVICRDLQISNSLLRAA